MFQELPQNKLSSYLPNMLTGEELVQTMTVLPDYSREICSQGPAARLLALESLSNLYLPSMMTQEIYSKIYLAMVHSLDKKNTIEAIRQSNLNFRRMQGLNYTGVLGGSDAFSIIGPSGIGKTTTIQKSMELAGGNRIIETKDPYTEIIPCISVQCPHDRSIRSLLLAILQEIDKAMDTDHYEKAIRAKASVDVLIGHVSQQLMLHGALLIIDECQNLCSDGVLRGQSSGSKLISALTQLINSTGISICLVGLPETMNVLGGEMQLARRNIGLYYQALPYDSYFQRLCETLFQYQCVATPTNLTEGLLTWIYEHSGGIIAVTVSLIKEAQQIAILDGSETLSIVSLSKAYSSRMQSIRPFISAATKSRPSSMKTNVREAVRKTNILKNTTQQVLQKEPEHQMEIQSEIQSYEGISLQEVVNLAREQKRDAFEALQKAGFTIEEVSV
jgi:hypothetical protein